MNANKSIVCVRPHKEPALHLAEDFIRALGNGVHSFEVWSQEGKVKLVVASSDPHNVLIRKIRGIYPHAKIEPIDVFPEIKGRDYDIGYVILKEPFYPIRTDFDVDPLNTLLSLMEEHIGVFQVVFTQADPKWVTKITSYAHVISKDRIVGWLNIRKVSPTKFEKDLANALNKKVRKPLYVVNIRICIFGENIVDVSDAFMSFFNHFKEFGEFQIMPIKGLFLKRKIKQTFSNIVQRRLDYNKISILSSEELSLLAHIVGDEVTASIEWVFEKEPHLGAIEQTSVRRIHEMVEFKDETPDTD